MAVAAFWSSIPEKALEDFIVLQPSSY